MTEVEREQEIYRVAHELFSTDKLDWVTFYREVLGLQGIIRKLYRDAELRAEFERSQTYRDIQEMLKKLREKPAEEGKEPPPTTVMTVRLPTDVYEALQEEAQNRRVSVNKLCISKLLQCIDDDLVPQRRSGISRGKGKKAQEKAGEDL